MGWKSKKKVQFYTFLFPDLTKAFICGVAADMDMQKCKYREFAKKQIEYRVGKEVRSYVVGYGPNPPTR